MKRCFCVLVCVCVCLAGGAATAELILDTGNTTHPNAGAGQVLGATHPNGGVFVSQDFRLLDNTGYLEIKLLLGFPSVNVYLTRDRGPGTDNVVAIAHVPEGADGATFVPVFGLTYLPADRYFITVTPGNPHGSGIGQWRAGYRPPNVLQSGDKALIELGPYIAAQPGFGGIVNPDFPWRSNFSPHFVFAAPPQVYLMQITGESTNFLLPVHVGHAGISFAPAKASGVGTVMETPTGASHSLAAESTGQLVEKTTGASRLFVFDPDNAGGDPVQVVLSALLDGNLSADVGGMASVEASMAVRDTVGNVLKSASRMFDTSAGELIVDERFSLPVLLTPGKTYELLTSLSLSALNGTADFGNTFAVQFVPIPEPATTLLLAFGAPMLWRQVGRRRNGLAN